MSTMAKHVIVAGADNRPPMLDKSQYNSWQSLDVLGTETSLPFTRQRTDDDLTDKEKIRKACDITTTNIVLQGLPPDIYSFVNHHSVAKEIWDRVKLLIEEKGETIHSYYLRFAQLINDMNTIGMLMKPLQVNMKFVNHLQPEWSNFVTDVKLVKDMHTTNFYQLYTYLRQHEAHAHEVRLMRQRFPNPLALVANTYNSPQGYNNQSQCHQQLLPVAQQYYSPPTKQQSYQAHVAYQTPVVHHQSYQAPAIHQELQASFPKLDSKLVVPSFLPS
ncbi:hypothetical protein Tco_1180153, partial [Tanacetum coccineum]